MGDLEEPAEPPSRRGPGGYGATTWTSPYRARGSRSDAGPTTTIVARSAGNTTLIATGGTFVQEIPVEVKVSQ